MSSSSIVSLRSAVDEARALYVARNPKSLECFRRAAECLPGGGTRSSIFIHPFPLFIARGEGTSLLDVDGHEYLDFVSDFTSGIYGKTNKVLRDAIVTALDNGIQLGAHTPFESRLASLIRHRFPSMELLRFANSGTEANLLAITTALKFTGKTKVMVFEGGYHGSLLSHFEVTKHQPVETELVDVERKNEANVLTAPFDYVVAPYNDLAATKSVIQANATSIGAIIVEPMLGAGGCIPGDTIFLHGLRKLASDIGAVFILDEVQTARLGFGGRQKTLGITPDLCTIGKFFGGGFAFGAFGGKREIMQMFDSRRPGAVSHGGTFNNSPCTMVAGATALEQILTEPALEALNSKGDEMRDSMNEAFKSMSAPYIVTGLGSINQLHCTLPGSFKTVGLDLVFFRLLEKGYWIAQRGLISLSFAMSQTDVDGFVMAVVNVVKEVQDLSMN